MVAGLKMTKPGKFNIVTLGTLFEKFQLVIVIPFLSFLPLFLSLSLSPSHTHTYTHTHLHAPTHTLSSHCLPLMTSHLLTHALPIFVVLFVIGVSRHVWLEADFEASFLRLFFRNLASASLSASDEETKMSSGQFLKPKLNVDLSRFRNCI